MHACVRVCTGRVRRRLPVSGYLRMCQATLEPGVWWGVVGVLTCSCGAGCWPSAARSARLGAASRNVPRRFHTHPPSLVLQRPREGHACAERPSESGGRADRAGGGADQGAAPGGASHTSKANWILWRTYCAPWRSQVGQRIRRRRDSRRRRCSGPTLHPASRLTKTLERFE